MEILQGMGDMLHEKKVKGKSKKAKVREACNASSLLPLSFLLSPYFSPLSCE
jgi:hypothetical protein